MMVNDVSVLRLAVGVSLLWLAPSPVRGDDVDSLLRMFARELVEITPGQGKFPSAFVMGSNAEAGEQPVHEVRLPEPFAIARYEVPQNLYQAVMGSNPSRWKGPRNAAEMMTWNEARTFCERITRQLRQAGLIADDQEIRLPSEAEWEYCCRAGTTTAYSFGETATAAGDAGKQATLLDPYGWHTGNAAGNDPPVGALKPNPWGLHDMHGYLREFTADCWHDDYAGAPADGTPRMADNTETSPHVVVRGGSWKDPFDQLRSASRRSFGVDQRDDAVGFRCVRAGVRR